MFCVSYRLTKAGSTEEAANTLNVIENKLSYMFGYELPNTACL